jgi:hypothetical protein
VKELTGYAVGGAMLVVLDAQIADLAKRQKASARAKLSGEVANLGRACAALVAELRKSKEDAEKTLDAYTPEQRVTLILGLVEKLSPEYRKAIGLHIEELGDRLIR